MLVLLDLLEHGLPPLLDLAQALLECVDAASHQAQVVAGLLAGGAPGPEQLGAAERPELLERAARVVQQAMLLLLAGQSVELGVDAAQLRREGLQPLAGDRVLSAERLFVQDGDRTHGIP